MMIEYLPIMLPAGKIFRSGEGFLLKKYSAAWLSSWFSMTRIKEMPYTPVISAI